MERATTVKCNNRERRLVTVKSAFNTSGQEPSCASYRVIRAVKQGTFSQRIGERPQRDGRSIATLLYQYTYCDVRKQLLGK